jgi:hypothetical protein
MSALLQLLEIPFYVALMATPVAAISALIVKAMRYPWRAALTVFVAAVSAPALLFSGLVLGLHLLILLVNKRGRSSDSPPAAAEAVGWVLMAGIVFVISVLSAVMTYEIYVRPRYSKLPPPLPS